MRRLLLASSGKEPWGFGGGCDAQCGQGLAGSPARLHPGAEGPKPCAKAPCTGLTTYALRPHGRGSWGPPQGFGGAGLGARRALRAAAAPAWDGER